jgi:hypothetical protein
MRDFFVIYLCAGQFHGIKGGKIFIASGCHKSSFHDHTGCPFVHASVVQAIFVGEVRMLWSREIEPNKLAYFKFKKIHVLW